MSGITLKMPSALEMYAFVSKVRTCARADTVTAIRAEAAKLLGEPVNSCPACGHPVLPDDLCPCLQYVGQPPNPASEQFKQQSA